MNNRRSFFKRSITSLAGLGFLLPAFAQPQKKLIVGRLIHMVFFWLKDDVDAKQFRKDTAAFLDQVPEVLSYHLGEPAGTEREVVDNSYTVSLVVTFESKQAQDKYQKNAVHQSYVEANQRKWTKVKIYDSWGML